MHRTTPYPDESEARTREALIHAVASWDFEPHKLPDEHVIACAMIIFETLFTVESVRQFVGVELGEFCPPWKDLLLSADKPRSGSNAFLLPQQHRSASSCNTSGEFIAPRTRTTTLRMRWTCSRRRTIFCVPQASCRPLPSCSNVQSERMGKRRRWQERQTGRGGAAFLSAQAWRGVLTHVMCLRCT